MSSSHKMKSNAELSPYQKRIETIDSPILCVAEVEKMIKEIGQDLASEIEVSCVPKTRWMKFRTLVFRSQIERFR